MRKMNFHGNDVAGYIEGGSAAEKFISSLANRLCTGDELFFLIEQYATPTSRSAWAHLRGLCRKIQKEMEHRAGASRLQPQGRGE